MPSTEIPNKKPREALTKRGFFMPRIYPITGCAHRGELFNNLESNSRLTTLDL